MISDTTVNIFKYAPNTAISMLETYWDICESCSTTDEQHYLVTIIGFADKKPSSTDDVLSQGCVTPPFIRPHHFEPEYL